VDLLIDSDLDLNAIQCVAFVVPSTDINSLNSALVAFEREVKPHE
jgi:hypothetical protein